ncbi:unnamed protein product, partial [marine sediment metagenome]
KADGEPSYSQKTSKRSKFSKPSARSPEKLFAEAIGCLKAEKMEYANALACLRKIIGILEKRSFDSIIKFINEKKWENILGQITQHEFAEHVNKIWSNFYQLLWKNKQWKSAAAYKKKIEYLQKLAKYNQRKAYDCFSSFCQEGTNQQNDRIKILAERAQKILLEPIDFVKKKEELLSGIIILHKFCTINLNDPSVAEKRQLVTQLYKQIIAKKDTNCLFLYLSAVWFDIIGDDEFTKDLLRKVHEDDYDITAKDK